MLYEGDNGKYCQHKGGIKEEADSTQTELGAEKRTAEILRMECCSAQIRDVNSVKGRDIIDE